MQDLCISPPKCVVSVIPKYTSGEKLSVFEGQLHLGPILISVRLV